MSGPAGSLGAPRAAPNRATSGVAPPPAFQGSGLASVPSNGFQMGAGSLTGATGNVITSQVQQQTNASINYAFVFANYQKLDAVPIQQGQIVFMESSNRPDGGNFHQSKGPSKHTVKAASLPYLNHMLAFYTPKISENMSEQAIWVTKNVFGISPYLNLTDDKVEDLKDRSEAIFEDRGDYKFYISPSYLTEIESVSQRIGISALFVASAYQLLDDIIFYVSFTNQDMEKEKREVKQVFTEKLEEFKWFPVMSEGQKKELVQTCIDDLRVEQKFDEYIRSAKVLESFLSASQSNTNNGDKQNLNLQESVDLSEAVRESMIRCQTFDVKLILSDASGNPIELIGKATPIDVLQDTLRLANQSSVSANSRQSLLESAFRVSAPCVSGAQDGAAFYACTASNKNPTVLMSSGTVMKSCSASEAKQIDSRRLASTTGEEILWESLSSASERLYGDAATRKEAQLTGVQALHNASLASFISAITADGADTMDSSDFALGTALLKLASAGSAQCSAEQLSHDMPEIESKDDNGLQKSIRSLAPTSGATVIVASDDAADSNRLKLAVDSSQTNPKSQRALQSHLAARGALFPPTARNQYYMLRSPEDAANLTPEDFLFNASGSFVRQHALVASLRGDTALASAVDEQLGASSVDCRLLADDQCRTAAEFDELADNESAYIGYESYSNRAPVIESAVHSFANLSQIDCPGSVNKMMPLELSVGTGAGSALPAFAYAPLAHNGETLSWSEMEELVHSALGSARATLRSFRAKNSAALKSSSAQTLASKQTLSGMNSDAGAAQHSLESESDFHLRLSAAVATIIDCAAMNATIIQPLLTNLTKTLEPSDADFAREVLVPLQNKRTSAVAWTRSMLSAKGRYSWRSEFRVTSAGLDQDIIKHGVRTTVLDSQDNQVLCAGTFPPVSMDANQWDPFDNTCDAARFSGFYAPSGTARRAVASDPWIGSTPGDFRFAATSDFADAESASAFVRSAAVKKTLSSAEKAKLASLLGPLPAASRLCQGKNGYVDVNTGTRALTVDAYSRKTSRSGSVVVPNSLFAPNLGNVNLALANSSPEIRVKTAAVVQAHSLLATVRSDAFLADCWSNTFNFGALGECTFAVAAQTQMQRLIEDALKRKRAIGFSKKEYDSSGKNTRLLLATETGRAIRYQAIESALDALDQYNEGSEEAKRASTLLQAVHVVTSSATLNIYSKTNFPGRSAKGMAVHSEIEQIIATLKNRTHEQNSPKGLGDGQNCEAAMMAGEFQYYLLTPEERGSLLAADCDVSKVTDVARRLPVGSSTLASGSAPQYGATYDGFGCERLLPDGALYGAKEGSVIDVTTSRAYTDENLARNVMQACVIDGVASIPLTDVLTALSPCTAPMIKPNIDVAQIGAAAAAGVRRSVRDELLASYTVDNRKTFASESGARLQACAGYFGLRLLKQAAVGCCEEAAEAARGARDRSLSSRPLDVQRHPYSQTLAPRISAAVNMAQAYEATLTDFDLSMAHAALTSPFVNTATCLGDAPLNRAAKIIFGGRTDSLASDSGAQVPRLLLQGPRAAVAYKTASGALLAVVSQAQADVATRVECATQQLQCSPAWSNLIVDQPQLAATGADWRSSDALATRKCKSAITKACDVVTSQVLTNTPKFACADVGCAVGISTSDPNQVVAAAKNCVVPNFQCFSGKQAAEVAAKCLVQNAQKLSSRLYAAASVDPTVTVRTLSGVNRSNLGGGIAQGDQTNVLDAVVASQFFATIAGIANQVDDDSGLLAAAAVLSAVIRMPSLTMQFEAATGLKVESLMSEDKSLAECAAVVARAANLERDVQSACKNLQSIGTAMPPAWEHAAALLESPETTEALHAVSLAVHCNGVDNDADIELTLRSAAKGSIWTDKSSCASVMLSIAHTRTAQLTLAMAANLVTKDSQDVTVVVGDPADKWWVSEANDAGVQLVNAEASSRALLRAVASGAGVDVCPVQSRSRASASSVINAIRATKGLLLHNAANLSSRGLSFGAAFALAVATPTMMHNSQVRPRPLTAAPSGYESHTDVAVRSRVPRADSVLTASGDIILTQECRLLTAVPLREQWSAAVESGGLGTLAQDGAVSTTSLLNAESGSQLTATTPVVFAPISSASCCEKSCQIAANYNHVDSTKLGLALRCADPTLKNLTEKLDIPVTRVGEFVVPKHDAVSAMSVQQKSVGTSFSRICVAYQNNHGYELKSTNLKQLKDSLALALENIYVQKSVALSDEHARALVAGSEGRRCDVGVVDASTGVPLCGDETVTAQVIAAARCYADVAALKLTANEIVSEAKALPDASDSDLTARIAPRLAMRSQHCFTAGAIMHGTDFVHATTNGRSAPVGSFPVRSPQAMDVESASGDSAVAAKLLADFNMHNAFECFNTANSSDLVETQFTAVLNEMKKAVCPNVESNVADSSVIDCVMLALISQAASCCNVRADCAKLLLQQYADGVSKLVDSRSGGSVQQGLVVADKCNGLLGFGRHQSRENFLESVLRSNGNQDPLLQITRRALSSDTEQNHALTSSIMAAQACKTPTKPFTDAYGQVSLPRSALALVAGSDLQCDTAATSNAFVKVFSSLLESAAPAATIARCGAEATVFAGKAQSYEAMDSKIAFALKNLLGVPLTTSQSQALAQSNDRQLTEDAQVLRDTFCLLGCDAGDLPTEHALALAEKAAAVVAKTEKLSSTETLRVRGLIEHLLTRVDHRSNVRLSEAAQGGEVGCAAMLAGVQSALDMLNVSINQTALCTRKAETAAAAAAVSVCSNLGAATDDSLRRRINANSELSTATAIDWMFSGIKTVAQAPERDAAGALAVILANVDGIEQNFFAPPLALQNVIAHERPLETLGETMPQPKQAAEKSRELAAEMQQAMRLREDAQSRHCQNLASIATAVLCKCAADGHVEAARLLGVVGSRSVSATAVQDCGTHFFPGHDSAASFAADPYWTQQALAKAHSVGVDTDNIGKYYKLAQLSATFSQTLAVETTCALDAWQALACQNTTLAAVAAGSARIANDASAGSDFEKACLACLEQKRYDRDSAFDHVAQTLGLPSGDDVVEGASSVARCISDSCSIGDLLAAVTKRSFNELTTPIAGGDGDLITRISQPTTSDFAQPRPALSAVLSHNDSKCLLVLTVAGSSVPSSSESRSMGLSCVGPLATAAAAAPYAATALVAGTRALCGPLVARVAGTEIANAVATVINPAAVRSAMGVHISDANVSRDSGDAAACNRVAAVARGALALSSVLFGTTTAKSNSYNADDIGVLTLDTETVDLPPSGLCQHVAPSCCNLAALWSAPFGSNTAAAAVAIKRQEAVGEDETLACDVAINSIASIAPDIVADGGAAKLVSAMQPACTVIKFNEQGSIAICENSSNASLSFYQDIILNNRFGSERLLNCVISNSLEKSCTVEADTRELRNKILQHVAQPENALFTRVSAMRTSSARSGENFVKAATIDANGLFEPLCNVDVQAALRSRNAQPFSDFADQLSTSRDEVNRSIETVRAAMAIARTAQTPLVVARQGLLPAESKLILSPSDIISTETTKKRPYYENTWEEKQRKNDEGKSNYVTKDEWDNELADLVKEADLNKILGDAPEREKIDLFFYESLTKFTRMWCPVGVVQREVDSHVSGMGGPAPQMPLANVTVGGHARTFNIWGDVKPGDNLYLMFVRCNAAEVRAYYKQLEDSGYEASASSFRPAAGSIFPLSKGETIGKLDADHNDICLQIMAYSTPYMDSSRAVVDFVEEFRTSSMALSGKPELSSWFCGAVRFGRCTGRDPGFVSEARCQRALHSTSDYVSLPLIDIQVGIKMPTLPSFGLIYPKEDDD